MADTKITGLTAATSLTDTDVMTAVTDIATTAVNKKITVANLKTSLAANLTGPVTSVGAATTLKQSKSFIITNPTTASDGPVWRANAACTITAVHVLCVDGTNIVGQLMEYDANGANGAAVDGSDITATAGTNANDDGALSNASIDSGDYVGWATTSVSGAVTKVIVTFEYTIAA